MPPSDQRKREARVAPTDFIQSASSNPEQPFGNEHFKLIIETIVVSDVGQKAFSLFPGHWPQLLLSWVSFLLLTCDTPQERRKGIANIRID
ncbi:hypothetical protein AVO44_01015 [Ruegeria profundi]|uniref:Uncharacterized protein n=1 Tax=Ruegeria profundi TaxID=1685378 RepID=A0A0X3U233_9RHOB|nr:hypothetical protein AVO44_01015 [Ruegeria profundi]